MPKSKHKPFADVFQNFVMATVEYAQHPRTPKATKKLMHALLVRVREQLAEEIEAHDAAVSHKRKR